MADYTTTRARFDALWDEAERRKKAGETARRGISAVHVPRIGESVGVFPWLSDDEAREVERLFVQLTAMERRHG